ncbi:MAG: alkaline shock response membrane anchor protein AmaP [Clostridia bacterium]
MKGFEKFVLIIFSIIIFIISLVVILVTTGMLNINTVISFFSYVINSNGMIILGISASLIVLAIFGIFSKNETQENLKSGLTIVHEGGSIYISKETFENLVTSITKEYASLRNTKTNIIISEEGLIVNVYTYILPDTIVPTITAKLQEDIKDNVLKQTTIEVKQANIKIKGVYNQIEKKV